jgi:hypothetical protein
MRDLFATALIVIAVGSYLVFLLVSGSPDVQQTRFFAALGIVLGFVAFVAVRAEDVLDNLGLAEVGLGIVSLGIGFAVLILSETTAAEVLLAVFMASLVLVWLTEMLDHFGVLPSAGHQTSLARRRTLR